MNDEINATTAGTLELERNYDFNHDSDVNFTSGIVIEKDNFIIEGNGHTIDGGNHARIFNITANNVTLKNINFLNGNASGNGGAIFSKGGLNLISCNFINNNATSGGAVFIEGEFTNSIINSTFINNSANNGGAVYFNGKLTGSTINSDFEHNNATRSGAAIYIKGNAHNNTFTSQFYSNAAKLASGGGIFFATLAENNRFESIFRYNGAAYGAGMFFYNRANNNRFDSDFRYNIAQSCGGAIFFYNQTNNNTFTGCFMNNSALGLIDPVNGNGGAITFKDTAKNAVFTCDFINNTAAKTGGGVNFKQTPYNITFNSDFVNNKAGHGGGVNFFESIDDVIFNGEFIANNAEYGGGICIKGGIIENVSFKDNHAQFGGAIAFSENGRVKNCEFTENNASLGGAINFESTGLVDNSTFDNNQANSGGAINAYGDLTVNSSSFNGNAATLGTNNVALNGNAKLTLKDMAYDLKPYKVVSITIINVTDSTDYGDIVNVTVNVTSEGKTLEKGMVFVSINNENQTATVENGIATLNMANLNAGAYNVIMTYIGDANYTKATKNVRFDVKPIIVPLEIENVANITYGDCLKVIANVGDSINTGEIYVIINNRVYAGNVVNGTGTIEIPKLNAGKYAAIVIYSDINHIASIKKISFNVEKKNATISAKNAAYVINYGGKYSVTVKGAAGEKVRFALNGKSIGSATANANGVAAFTLTAKMLKAANAGSKNLVVKLASGNYNCPAKTVKITVKKEAAKLVGKKKTFKKALKVKKYGVTLKNSKGKAISKAKVTLKVKGKTFKATTNAKGKATFKIKNLNKKGTFKVTVAFKGNAYYNKATKAVKIKIK